MPLLQEGLCDGDRYFNKFPQFYRKQSLKLHSRSPFFPPSLLHPPLFGTAGEERALGLFIPSPLIAVCVTDCTSVGGASVPHSQISSLSA